MDFFWKMLEKKILNCSLCEEWLNTPVHLHPSLGNICSTCQPDLSPEHRTECVQNSALETILVELSLPCKFYKNGCRQKMAFDKIRSHQKKCKFRTMPCLTRETGCEWVGSPSKLEEHFRQEHAEHVVEGRETNLFIFNIEFHSQGDVLVVKLLPSPSSRSHFFKVETNTKNQKVFYTMYSSSVKAEEYVNVNSIDASGNKTIICRVNPVDDAKYTVELPAGVDKTVSYVIKCENMKEFNSKMMEYVECLICNNIMKPPIYQCKTGHSLCNVCKSKLRQCPTCRQELGNTRNYALETIAANLIYECKNKEFGCEAQLTLDEMEEHANKCSLKNKNKYQCPVANDCRMLESLEKLSEHVVADHLGEGMAMGSYRNFIHISILTNDTVKTENFTKLLVENDGNIFKLNLRCRNKSLEWSLRVLQQSCKEMDFVYEIGITNEAGSRRKFIKKNLSSNNAHYCFNLEDIYPLIENNRLYYYCKVKMNIF